MPQGKKKKQAARKATQLKFMATSLERGYIPLSKKQKSYFKRVLTLARKAKKAR
jgi:hypothetical protein